MTKTERIEELERQLAELKAQCAEEEKPDFPMAMANRDGDTIVVFTGDGDNGTQIAGEYRPGKFGKYADMWRDPRGTHWHPFDGTITYKNGKPVKTEEE